MPYGMPADSFVLLAGESGNRHRCLQTELLWRVLTRGEPAIVISYVDPPIAIVEHFLTFGWNVLPFLESGALRIIDCFTARLRDEHQTPDHQADWNAFLVDFLEASVSMVHDTGNLIAVEDTLHTELETKEMAGTGVVVIDSLNEVERQGHELEVEQFIKEVRGDVCSRKFVPIFASVTSSGNDRPTMDYTYLFDGIIEMRRTESHADGVRLKQLGIERMDGVRYRPHWVNYVIDSPMGFRIFDPGAELPSVYGSPSAPRQPVPSTHQVDSVSNPHPQSPHHNPQ